MTVDSEKAKIGAPPPTSEELSGGSKNERSADAAPTATNQEDEPMDQSHPTRYTSMYATRKVVN